MHLLLRTNQCLLISVSCYIGYILIILAYAFFYGIFSFLAVEIVRVIIDTVFASTSTLAIYWTVAANPVRASQAGKKDSCSSFLHLPELASHAQQERHWALGAVLARQEIALQEMTSESHTDQTDLLNPVFEWTRSAQHCESSIERV